jgi:hypothetical protein
MNQPGEARAGRVVMKIETCIQPRSRLDARAAHLDINLKRAA